MTGSPGEEATKQLRQPSGAQNVTGAIDAASLFRGTEPADRALARLLTAAAIRSVRPGSPLADDLEREAREELRR